MSEFERRMKEATERAERDFTEGVVREPVSAFRVEIEQAMLAKQQGLGNRAAHAKLVDLLSSKNMTVRDFQRLPNREKLDLVREAFVK